MRPALSLLSSYFQHFWHLSWHALTRTLRVRFQKRSKRYPAQRDRIEDLYLEQKSWTYPSWRERYLDHPVVGTLARRLIWKFTNEQHKVAGIFHGSRIVGRDGPQ